MKKISVVIPAFNEEKSIVPLYRKISKTVRKDKDNQYELVFIDDGSSDETYSQIKKVILQSKKTALIKVIGITFSKNFGKTAALDEGIKHSTGDYIIFMDADLQDDPQDIHRFVTAIKKKNVDVVIGNRKNRYRKSFIKKISSAIANLTIRAIAGINIHDINCGFKILKRSAATSLILKSDYHRFIPLLCSSNGFTVGEITISQHRRVYGDSKYGSTGLLRFTKSIIDAISITFIFRFKNEPFNFFGKIGGAIFLLGMSILTILSLEWFLGKPIMGRPLFFFGILSVITGINLVSMGFLGELFSYKEAANQQRAKEIID